MSNEPHYLTRIAFHWLLAAINAYRSGDHKSYAEYLQNINPEAAPIIIMTLLPWACETLDAAEKDLGLDE